jgi:zinc protease
MQQFLRLFGSCICLLCAFLAVALGESRQLFFKLIYGSDNILGYNVQGTRESIDKIGPGDLKAYYDRCFSPSVTKIYIAGNITREQVIAALKPLADEWKAKDVALNKYPSPSPPEKSMIYFVDMPGSRQSVIYTGYPAISRDNPDFVKTEFINYRLGGAFTIILNQILREEKGYTYGLLFPEETKHLHCWYCQIGRYI